MRRLVLIMLVLGLSAPAAALAVRELPGDGTLVVDNARGVVTVRARGGIIGGSTRAGLTIDDPIEGDGGAPFVYGADRVSVLGPHTTLYVGEDVPLPADRRLPTASLCKQSAMDISAVGRGSATAGRQRLLGAARPVPDQRRHVAADARRVDNPHAGTGNYSTTSTTTTQQGQDPHKEKPQGPGGQHG